MKRFNTISVIEDVKIIDYKQKKDAEEKGKYIVDRTRFTPVADLAKSVVNQQIGKTDLVRYDYPDGIDNGSSVPLARKRPELAELSVDVKRQQKKVKENIETAKKIQEIKQVTENLYTNSEGNE